MWHPDTPIEYRNAIVTGDARVLSAAIPDESVGLIFTNPVYDRIEDYEWLSDMAMRVLKPEGSALVFCGIDGIGQVIAAMQAGGLEYRWLFGGFMPGRRKLLYRVMSRWFPCLWFGKGHSQPKRLVFDMSISNVNGHILPDGDTAKHKWQKPIDWFPFYLCGFTDAGDVVYDPFAGGGTIPAVCKMLSRDWLASEIDPDTAERARERVLLTQPPLFVPEPEQAALGI